MDGLINNDVSQIKSDITALTRSIDNTNTNVNDLSARVTTLELDDTDRDIHDVIAMRTEIEQLKDQVATLIRCQTRTDIEKVRYEKDLIELRSHSMKSNLIINFNRKN